jgi:hypothetical protein
LSSSFAFFTGLSGSSSTARFAFDGVLFVGEAVATERDGPAGDEDAISQAAVLGDGDLDKDDLALFAAAAGDVGFILVVKDDSQLSTRRSTTDSLFT